VTIGATGSEHVLINGTGVALKDNTTTYATFASTVTLGNTADAYMTLASDAMKMFDEAGTQQIELNTGVLTLGGADGSTDQTVVINSSGVTNYYDVSNYTQMDSDSFDIYTNGQLSASFGATVSIGPTGGGHVLVTSNGFRIKNSSTIYADFGDSITLGQTGTEHIAITTTSLSLKDGATTHLIIDATGLRTSGSIYASYINASDSGLIGGWTIGANTLTGGDIELKQSGYIKIGTLADTQDTTDTSVGTYFANDGTFLIKAGGANSGFISGSAGGVLGINAPNFELQSSGILISSRQNRVAAGTSNTIAIMDGDEGFWAGNATFGSAPFNVDLNGNLSASSAHIAGNITATDGNIGGWTIAATELFNANLHLSTNDAQGVSSLYIESASSRVSVRVAEGDFSVDVDASTNILGTPIFATSTA